MTVGWSLSSFVVSPLFTDCDDMNTVHLKQWNSIQLFHTFLCNSQNYHPQGTVDDPMNCCPKPMATVHRVIHSTEGLMKTLIIFVISP